VHKRACAIGTQFTCFTGTKVGIGVRCGCRVGGVACTGGPALHLLYLLYWYFTGTKVGVLTQMAVVDTGICADCYG
jgi:hypothetical protein